MFVSKRLQYATNVSTGISSMISGSDTNVTNNGVLRSVNGLAFANSTIRSFNATVTVSIIRTSGGNLFETFTLEGNQKDSSWDLVVSSVGDNTFTTFSITSAGQVQHTTAVISNWTSTTLRYSATQLLSTGSLTGLSSTTTGSYIINSIQLSDTTDAVSGVSNGPLYILGGATISKNLNVSSISSANTINTNITTSNLSSSNIVTSALTTANLAVTTNITTANMAVGVLTAGNLRVPGALTAGNLAVPGTLTVTNITVNNLVQSSGSVIATGITTNSLNLAGYNMPMFANGVFNNVSSVSIPTFFDSNYNYCEIKFRLNVSSVVNILLRGVISNNTTVAPNEATGGYYSPSNVWTTSSVGNALALNMEYNLDGTFTIILTRPVVTLVASSRCHYRSFSSYCYSGLGAARFENHGYLESINTIIKSISVYNNTGSANMSGTWSVVSYY